jgi:PIN domain nuclease of toxin-antitoxin system
MAAAPDRLSRRARGIVEDADNELFLSAASAWEIAIKFGLGKLQLPEPPDRYVPSRLTTLRTTPLAISHEHALRVSALPAHHRDPFDRLLIAQSQIEDLPIMTADDVFLKYNASIIPA